MTRNDLRIALQKAAAWRYYPARISPERRDLHSPVGRRYERRDEKRVAMEAACLNDMLGSRQHFNEDGEAIASSPTATAYYVRLFNELNNLKD